MKYIFAFLLLVGLYFVGVVSVFLYKKSHLPELPALVHAESVVGQGQPLRYIAAGDSTAVGVGASELATTYPMQVAAMLARTTEVSYKNVAVSGAKTEDFIATQLPQILEYKPDVVTISIGANDATHLRSNERVLQNFKTILNTLVEKTDAVVYVANIPNFSEGTLLPWFYQKLLESRSVWLNRQIAELATDRVRVVNVHDTLLVQHNDRSKTFAADGFHPNDAGYANWTAAFQAEIETK